MKSLIALLVALGWFVPVLCLACEISSHGSARPKPEKAFVLLRIIAQDEDAATAKKKVGDKSVKLAAALTGAGVDAKNIRSSEIADANPEYDPQQSSIFKVAQWSVAEVPLDAKKSEDENLQLIARVMDAAVAAGAEPASFGGTEDGGQYNPYSRIHNYDGNQDIQQNDVVFSISNVDTYVEKAMADAVARANSVAEAIGRIIQDKPQGLDSISVGKTPSDTEWRTFQLGTAAPTSNAVDINVSVDTAVRYSHGDTTVGGSAHGHDADHHHAEGISATGVGRLPVPVEQAVVLHRKSVSQKTVVESLAKLNTDVGEMSKKLADAKIGEHQLSMSGVGFTLGGSPMEMMYAMSSGTPAKPKSACYRDLSLTIPRKSDESLIDFQNRVGKFTEILAGKSDETQESSQPAFQSLRRYQAMLGAQQTATYYMAVDMQAFLNKIMDAAFADAKAQAERAARVTSQQLAGISSTHPDEDVPLSDFLSTLKLGTTYTPSNGGLNPNTAAQSMTLAVTVQYKTSKSEAKSEAK